MAGSRSHLVLDIETILDPELPLGQAAGETVQLPAPPHHQIVVMGALLFDEAHRVKKFGVVSEKASDEVVILREFVRFFEERRPTLVTWNGRGFDLPVIAARCLRHGVAFRPYYDSRDVRYRFSPDGHLDMMDFLADFGASKAAKLDVAAKLVGMPGKVGIDGKDIGPFIHAGRLAEVQAYCMSDVLQTAAVFLRLELVRGRLDRAAYGEAMTGLLETAETEPRVRVVVEAWNRARLLLEA